MGAATSTKMEAELSLGRLLGGPSAVSAKKRKHASHQAVSSASGFADFHPMGKGSHI